MPHPDERCRNPWTNDCEATNIEVYLADEESQLPICAECWQRIADDAHEWELC